MRKRSVIITLVIAAVLLMGAYIFLNSEPAVSPSNNQTNSVREAPSQPGETTGTYVDYSEATLADAKGTRILFFHASWCSQCRALEADIKRQGVPADITILKVDYDKSQDLRKKYGVTLQTTVVKVDEQGNLVSKFTPYQKPTLENALSNL